MTINRRTMLQTLAAITIAPTIRLRSEVDIERLMLPFCDKEIMRYDVAKPFAIDSLTYATDARAIIRAELSSVRDGGERKVPPAANLWKQFWNPIKWHDYQLPKVDQLTIAIPTGNACPLCDGRRISLGMEFPKEINNENWCYTHNYDVDDNSIADRSCELCKGDGADYRGPSVVRIGAKHYSYSLFKRINALPGLQVADCDIDDEDKPLLFRAEHGIEGMAMCMSGWAVKGK